MNRRLMSMHLSFNDRHTCFCSSSLLVIVPISLFGALVSPPLLLLPSSTTPVPCRAYYRRILITLTGDSLRASDMLSIVQNRYLDLHRQPNRNITTYYLLNCHKLLGFLTKLWQFGQAILTIKLFNNDLLFPTWS